MLRHTFCTRCAEAGLDIKVLQMIMGHSDISITMNIYNHVDAARVQNEIKKLENVIIRAIPFIGRGSFMTIFVTNRIFRKHVQGSKKQWKS